MITDYPLEPEYLKAEGDRSRHKRYSTDHLLHTARYGTQDQSEESKTRLARRLNVAPETSLEDLKSKCIARSLPSKPTVTSLVDGTTTQEPVLM